MGNVVILVKQNSRYSVVFALVRTGLKGQGSSAYELIGPEETFVRAILSIVYYRREIDPLETYVTMWPRPVPPVNMFRE